MRHLVQSERTAFLESALVRVPAEGWSMMTVQATCGDCGKTTDDFTALFPGGVEDLVAEFSNFLDDKMAHVLEGVDIASMRVRDRIEMAVLTRLAEAAPYKDACRLALAFWSVPPRTLRAGRVLWRTADRMWQFAGDTATDYNRYTKRGLLVGVLTATTLVWIKDHTPNQAVTRQFLARRIENVLQLGRALGKIKPGSKSS